MFCLLYCSLTLFLDGKNWQKKATAISMLISTEQREYEEEWIDCYNCNSDANFHGIPLCGTIEIYMFHTNNSGAAIFGSYFVFRIRIYAILTH